MQWRRPALHTEPLVLLGSLYLLLALNLPFWRAALEGRELLQPSTWAFALALLGSFTAAYSGFIALVATRRTVRPLLAALFVLAAAVGYYADRYAVYFDRHMAANVLATHWTEAQELLGGELVRHILLFGVLPATLLWWPRLERRTLLRAAAVRTGFVMAAAGVSIGCLLPVFADFASLMRNHREVRHLLAPGNAIAAVGGQLFGRSHRPGGALQAVGQDARPAASWHQRRPALLVLVVGETARARNFSLNGYPRETNPELARRGVISFTATRACGTSTEVSLPCMFSATGRRDYDESRILSQESVLHVLQRAGFSVLWRDNQSGCKGVCAGLPSEQLDHAAVEGLCAEGQCFDEVLLHGMDRIARDAHGNLVVVLHQLGSHGPSYHRRYPAAYRRFTPACEQDDLRRCTAEEIVNTYDNSLLYTDHVLGRVIDFLQGQQDRFDTAMLYVADHGESLGEAGLYLHGMPYAIAPEVQTHVPMVAWLSPAFARSAALDTGCLAARAGRPLAHDHLFHSLLGILDVETGAYDPAWDLFQPCRPRQVRLPP